MFCLFCSDPVKNQLVEIERLDALRTKTAQIVLEQQDNISIEKSKLRRYEERVENEISKNQKMMWQIQDTIKTCGSILARKYNSFQWREWNHVRKENMKMLEYASGKKADYIRGIIRGLENSEPLSMNVCKRNLPRMRSTVSAYDETIGSLRYSIKKKRFETERLLRKMNRDLRASTAILDSINTMHTNAVFALSKMNTTK